MSWRKRRKLPPTIRVHLINDNIVEVFPRRMKMEDKNLIQNALKEPKRKQKYKVHMRNTLSLQQLN